jgi:hypothetical protein
MCELNLIWGGGRYGRVTVALEGIETGINKLIPAGSFEYGA